MENTGGEANFQWNVEAAASKKKRRSQRRLRQEKGQTKTTLTG
jgi:hypothetical protein